MTDWVPAYQAWPVSHCAVFGCGGWRYEDYERNQIRRWCKIHCYLRDQVVKIEGGQVLEPLVPQWQREPA